LTPAAQRARRHRQQEAELNEVLFGRLIADESKAQALMHDDADGVLAQLEALEREAELQLLAAQQERDDTYFVDRRHGEISLDASGPNGGTVGDLIGVDPETGDVVSYLRPSEDKNLGVHDGPGQPALRELSPDQRMDIAARFEAAETRHLAQGKTRNQARRAAVCELPELRELPPAWLHDATGVSLRSLERWRAQNGGSIPREVEEEWRLPSRKPYTGRPGGGSDGPYPGGLSLIKRQIHGVPGAPLARPTQRELAPIIPDSVRRPKTHDPHPVPDPSQSRASSRRARPGRRGAARLRVPDPA
jgi:hypothetical protein